MAIVREDVEDDGLNLFPLLQRKFVSYECGVYLLEFKVLILKASLLRFDRLNFSQEVVFVGLRVRFVNASPISRDTSATRFGSFTIALQSGDQFKPLPLESGSQTRYQAGQ